MTPNREKLCTAGAKKYQLSGRKQKSCRKFRNFVNARCVNWFKNVSGSFKLVISICDKSETNICFFFLFLSKIKTQI